LNVALFCHSIVSDWNHGNAHFLRGIATELIERGHEVRIYEPTGGWSLSNLIANHGTSALKLFHQFYPQLHSRFYDPHSIDLDRELDCVDLVIVHEWNDAVLVRRVGEHRARTRRFTLLFHDTHHREVSEPDPNMRCDLRNYDGVLAFGHALRELYLRECRTQRAWVWHEAADTRVFRPPLSAERNRDLVWIGNWGDGERTAALHKFLILPIREESIDASIYGVRYPENALRQIHDAGILYEGWIPNFEVPRVFAQFKVTVHIPRGLYVEALPGIPTIRVFEALACGIPLICAPWNDAENLFQAGSDYLVAYDTEDMRRKCRAVINDPSFADELSDRGLRAIRDRHTCAHRVNELLKIHAELRGISPSEAGDKANDI